MIASTLIAAMGTIAALAAGPSVTGEADRPLHETRWVLSDFVDGDTATPVSTVRPAYLLFHPLGPVEGYNGCNYVNASAAAVDADTLNITGLGTTKRFCPDHSLQWEVDFLHVLAGEIDYRIEEDALWLIHPDGKGLLLRAEAP